MQITLKSLKVARNLSEETTAYTAIICVDGKPAFHAKNQGQGGCDLYYPIDGYTGPTERQINEWCAANLPPLDMSAYGMADSPCTMELHVGNLIHRAESEKRLARMLKAKIVILGEHKGQPALFTAKLAPTAENILWAKNNPRKASETIVNGADEAVLERALALV